MNQPVQTEAVLPGPPGFFPDAPPAGPPARPRAAPSPSPAPPARPLASFPADPASAEREWVVRSQAGDRAAFEQLVRHTARELYARLYLDTGDAHKAEDLVQETFLIAWRNIAQVTDPSGLRPWLFSVANSARIDAARREGRKKRGGPAARGAAGAGEMESHPDPAPSPAESAERGEQRRRVLSLLRELPAKYREPLALRYLAGADYAAIAQQLNLSDGSLRGLLNRGLAQLREKMEAVKT